MDIEKARTSLNKIKIDYDKTYKHKNRYLNTTKTNATISVELYENKDFKIRVKKTSDLTLNECIENIDKNRNKLKIQYIGSEGGSETKKSCIALYCMMYLNNIK